MIRKHPAHPPFNRFWTERADGKTAIRLLNAAPAVRQCVLFAVLLLPVAIYAFPSAADIIVYEPFNGKGEEYNYLICCMLATAVIETAFFLLCGYKDRRTLMYVFFINLLSNLLLNFKFLPLLLEPFLKWWIILAYETVVIVFEFILLGFRTGWKSKIFGLLIIANILSYGTGELYYRLVYFDSAPKYSKNYRSEKWDPDEVAVPDPHDEP